ncbi:sulfate ABC transporter substrate-binding protein [Lolliginicoccus levis]|uniref:sulfate ABC transporter substrate-binding protein n=1 Tax=Lolliginicoccus levis TaxID=2919542 RepID=UPI00241F3E78|nr:sulfate ABC transporter substrate-binding protein [Lolliginicoccus levis]
MRPQPRGYWGRRISALAAAAALMLAGCAGGPSDIPGKATIGGDGSRGTLALFAYAVAKPGFDEVIPAFAETPEGEGISFLQSFGASADQSRKVTFGAPADVVAFSTAPDVERLVSEGLVREDWNDGEHGGVPFGSVVTLVVREGNPLGITEWDDLLRPGIEVITPNPFSSGSAKWNLLAPYAVASKGGEDPEAGLEFVERLVNDHITIQPGSAREATEAFLQGRGDVLITYENEAIFLERNGDPLEHVIPPRTLRIDNPMAIVDRPGSATRPLAEDFLEFQYTAAGQRAWAEAGYRPVIPGVLAEFDEEFPEPEQLWTVDELGGWDEVNATLFDPEKGFISVIYYEALR